MLFSTQPRGDSCLQRVRKMPEPTTYDFQQQLAKVRREGQAKADKLAGRVQFATDGLQHAAKEFNDAARAVNSYFDTKIAEAERQVAALKSEKVTVMREITRAQENLASDIVRLKRDSPPP